MGLRHPPVHSEEAPPHGYEKVLGAVAAGLLALTLAPAPFTM